MSELAPAGIYERSEGRARQREGLDTRSGMLWGDPPPALLEVSENGLRFQVDLIEGQKTGFFLDQRGNRELVEKLSRGARVLNCFAYTGGFGIWALRGGADHVTDVESSSAAIELAGRHVEINGFGANQVDSLQGDVFQVLREFRNSNRCFDLIVLDPPKFVDSRNQMLKGTRGYKDINLLAFKRKLVDGAGITAAGSG